jgi:hypothetical protein
MLELGIVKRSAGFPYVEGADVCPTEVRVEETRSFRLERDICRLIQDLTTTNCRSSNFGGVITQTWPLKPPAYRRPSGPKLTHSG